MGFEINKPLSVGGINPNIYVDQSHKYNTGFGNIQSSDTFELTSIDRFTTELAIKKMIANNPRVRKIAIQYNPELKLNLTELNELLKGHATDTKDITKGIIEHLPYSMQTKVNTKALEEASYLHDLGKVLIPPEILNKPAKLDERERKIMQTHSEVSYELLKTSGLNKNTLNLIRHHHQNAKHTGYPWVNKDFNADINLQILSVADKYSALTEKRTYKEPLGPKEALTIIYQEVKEEKLNPIIFKALVNYAKETAPEKLLV